MIPSISFWQLIVCLTINNYFLLYMETIETTEDITLKLKNKIGISEIAIIEKKELQNFFRLYKNKISLYFSLQEGGIFKYLGVSFLISFLTMAAGVFVLIIPFSLLSKISFDDYYSTYFVLILFFIGNYIYYHLYEYKKFSDCYEQYKNISSRID